MLAYYVHDLSPFIVKFGRSFFLPGIRWYGISYLMGFIAAYFILFRLAKTGFLRIPPERVPDLVLNGCIWGVLVGGRLGHVAFYEPSLLWDFGNGFPYWGVLKVWQGGMSAHGGVIGVIITLIIFCKRNRYSIINVGDACCMVVPLGLMFGRIANFINGELYGRVSSVPWAVKFPTELSSPTNSDVSQKVLSHLPWLSQDIQIHNDLIINKLPVTLDNVQASVDKVMDKLQMAEVQVHGARDLVTLVQNPRDFFPQGVPAADMQSVRNTVRDQLSAILPPRHPSQLYESCLEGALLFLICWFIGQKWKKPGMASGAFLTFYPIMRIAGEQFRIGDVPPDWLAWTGQSQGTLLSLLMIIPGAIYWIYWIRKPAPTAIAAPHAAPIDEATSR